MEKIYNVNGRLVKSWYAGIVNYSVEQNGETVGTCWDVEGVAYLCNTDIDTVISILF